MPRLVLERYLGEIYRVLTPNGHLVFQLPIGPGGSMAWDELKYPRYVSELDTHLYAIYADNCACAGNHQEGIHTLQTLVNKNPDYLAGDS